MTELLTQTDKSSENKLSAQLARTVGGQLVEKGGRRRRDGAMKSCSI